MNPRQHIRFDDCWRFHLGKVEGGERPGLNDKDWRLLDLPHDWSAEDLPGREGPFREDAIGNVSTGFAVGGTAWYRKRFKLPRVAKGNRIRIQFDGVYMNADVWVNGKHVGNHPYGYTSFAYDITRHVRPGKENVVAVEVKNEGKNTRWYSGSGIYRHVWLSVVDAVHVAQWGTYITTPFVGDTHADVRVRTMLTNMTGERKEVTVRTRLLGPGGQAVGKAETKLKTGVHRETDQLIKVARPKRWSIETPRLYAAVSEVVVRGKVVDRVKTDFGIRTISFDAKNGFLLNGRQVLMKGACMHHDNGCLGSAAFDAAEERRVRTMKQNGYNAIRTSHNPVSPHFLAACDKLGVVVIDESFDHWEWPKNPQDYHNYFKAWWKKDVESMVKRDRNHPCVVMWSIGNEIPERGSDTGMRNARMQAEYIRSLDPTRPVTEAVCGRKEPWAEYDRYFAIHDVCGYNYKRDEYRPDHKRAPHRVMYAAESFPMGAFNYWMDVVDLPYVIGDFVWTGHDYLGEAGIGWFSWSGKKSTRWPWTVAYCGDIDLCGFKRPPSYYRDVLWGCGRKLSIMVHNPVPTFAERDRIYWGWDDVLANWNWPGREGTRFKVDVYSACEKVKLTLNGRSLGTKKTSRATKFKATWKVPYQPGTLKAVGFVGKRQAAKWEIKTAGSPAKLKVAPDKRTLKADGQDLSFVRIDVLDAKGVPHPTATNMIHFRVEGAGTLAGAGNGNPMSTASFQRPQRRAFEGRALAVVKSGKKRGPIKLIVESAGMAPVVVGLKAT